MIALAAATYTPIIYIVGTLLAGGLLQLVYSIARNYRRGPIDDTSIVSQTVRDDVEGLRGLLAEYRLETEVNKRQLENYAKDVRDMTRELAQAQLRISNLEKQLREGDGRREIVERELSEIRHDRDRLAVERDRLIVEATAMRARVAALEEAAALVDKLRESHEHPD